MKVVLVTDDLQVGYLPMLISQLQGQGIDYEVVMTKKPWAWKKKLQASIQGIGDYKGKVCLVDNYDMAFFGTSDELRTKVDAPLIFAGERNCFPDPGLAISYPYCETPWQYLNAGGVAGDAEAVRNFLSAVAEGMEMIIPAGSMDTDQLSFTHKYLEGIGKIDSRCRIFHCMFNDPPGTLIAHGSRFINTVTGETPCFVHGNGHSYVLNEAIFPPYAKVKAWGW